MELHKINTDILRNYDFSKLNEVEEDIDIFDDKHPKEKPQVPSRGVPSRRAPTYYT